MPRQLSLRNDRFASIEQHKTMSSYSIYCFFLLILVTALAVDNENNIINRNDSHSDRIVGGTIVTSRTYDYFVTSSRLSCGAVLIHDDIVLTAAHCLEQFFSGFIVGMYQVSEARSLKKYFGEREILHPSYSRSSRSSASNDLALFKLQEPVVGVQPVQWAASAQQPESGTPIDVIGFGLTQERGVRSPDLREVTVNTFSTQTCKSAYPNSAGSSLFDPTTMFCAGVRGGGKDSCQGDSGGPALVKNGGSATVVGLVSWGIGCARANGPGVYTRLGQYDQWIKDQICLCSSVTPSYCGSGTVAGGNVTACGNRFGTGFPRRGTDQPQHSGGLFSFLFK